MAFNLFIIQLTVFHWSLDLEIQASEHNTLPQPKRYTSTNSHEPFQLVSTSCFTDRINWDRNRRELKKGSLFVCVESQWHAILTIETIGLKGNIELGYSSSVLENIEFEVTMTNEIHFMYQHANESSARKTILEEQSIANLEKNNVSLFATKTLRI